MGTTMCFELPPMIGRALFVENRGGGQQGVEAFVERGVCALRRVRRQRCDPLRRRTS